MGSKGVSFGDKDEFLKEFGADYGYPDGPKSVDEIRATEVKRLQNDSQSDSSSAACDIVREACQQVLGYCNESPKDYKCIFTSGARSALKLVGEVFPWSQQSNFVYTMENHNSILGIREYALSQGAAAFAIDIEEAVHNDGLSETPVTSMNVSLRPVQRRNNTQFTNGEPTSSKFNLDLVNIMKKNPARILGNSPYHRGCWMVLIDAAKGCVTQLPDLSKYPADFVAISFYKIFGYPTGLGALIVRNDAASLLKMTYFCGDTVAASIVDIDFVRRRQGIEELFEDGTAAFLSMVSLRHGFNIINSLTVSAINRYASLFTVTIG